jgi:hypothetical protein
MSSTLWQVGTCLPRLGRCLAAMVVVLAGAFYGAPAAAEGFEPYGALKVETTWLRRSDGASFQVLIRSEVNGGGSQILVRWRSHGKPKEQILFEGVTSGVDLQPGGGSKLSVRFWGNRYDSDGSYVLHSWRWELQKECLIELPPVTHDPWVQKKRQLRALLAADQFDKAWALADEMGPGPNGFFDESDEQFQLFVGAVHRRATALHRAGRKEAAAALVVRLLTAPPYEDWPSTEEEVEWFVVEYERLRTSVDKPSTKLLSRIRVTAANVAYVNDLGFFLVEGDEAVLALVLLEQVVARAPERVVAWLNLADAQWDRRDSEPDERSAESYRRYIDGMTRQGRQSAIPARAWQRAGVSPPVTPERRK